MQRYLIIAKIFRTTKEFHNNMDIRRYQESIDSISTRFGTFQWRAKSNNIACPFSPAFIPVRNVNDSRLCAFLIIRLHPPQLWNVLQEAIQVRPSLDDVAPKTKMGMVLALPVEMSAKLVQSELLFQVRRPFVLALANKNSATIRIEIIQESLQRNNSICNMNGEMIRSYDWVYASTGQCFSITINGDRQLGYCCI